MELHLAAPIRSYDDAMAFLGDRETRRLAPQTDVIRLISGVVGVRYRDTLIVFYVDAGKIVMDSGGDRSEAVQLRIAALLPQGYELRRDPDGTWTLINARSEAIPFRDGMTVPSLSTVA